MALISEEEKRRLRLSNESIIGTNAMEGQFLDAPTLGLLRRYEEGELDQQGLSAAIDDHVRQLLANREPAQALIAQIDAA
jgi:hypothetical protein